MVRKSAENQEQGVVFGIGSFIFIICAAMVIAFCVTETVISQSKNGANETEAYYQELEEAYIQEIKQILYEEGFYNSEVMLLSIEEDASRSYLVKIHHRRIREAKGDKQERLLARLQQVRFPGRREEEKEIPLQLCINT